MAAEAKEVDAFVGNLLSSLRETRNVALDLTSDCYLLESSNLKDLLESLCRLLESEDRSSEALSINHVLELSITDKDLGGLGFSSLAWAELPEGALHDVQFLVDAWLEALNSAEATRALPVPLQTKSPITRPMTLAEKIFAHHAYLVPSVEGLKAGDLIRVSVDWIIASELSWVGMKHSMLSIGEQPTVWRNDRFWLAGDHTVDPRTYEQERVRELVQGLEKARKDFRMTENQGSNYTILHTEFVRERAEPGMLVLGSDSHTCSAGAVSCLAIGLGAADVMAGLATGQTWFKVPESIWIELVGVPKWYIRGKDVILYILKQLKRNTHAADRIVEFGGPGAQYLSCDARFAIANMCTELGGITGLFVPDNTTRTFVDGRKHKMYKSNSLYFRPDEGAAYAAKFEINIGEVDSFIALYPSPDDVVPVAERLDMTFDGCFIGACTTTEEDLILAALVLEVGLKRGLHINKGKRIVVAGSLPIVRNLVDLGLSSIYSAAGFELPAPSCSLCLGMGADRAGEGEHWLSSQNRNFKNRMGKGAIGNICSAATVAASSFSMKLTDPADLLADVSVDRYNGLLKRCKRRGLPQRPEPSPCRYVEPFLNYKDPQPNQCGDGLREPNGASDSNQVIKSKVYALGDFVDTDAIIPAAFILESPTNELLASHCLEFTNPDFRENVRRGLDVVVAGRAFGCGSSREEAPRALKGLGVKCVIAKSFSFIYGRNQPTIALLGINITDDAFYDLAQTGQEIEIDVPARAVRIGGREFPFVLDEMELRLIETRGLAAAYVQFGAKVFQSLCNGTPSVSTSTLADVTLKRDQKGVREELAW